MLLTEATRCDVKLADSFRLNPGSIVAIDRAGGYIDYAPEAHLDPAIVQDSVEVLERRTRHRCRLRREARSDSFLAKAPWSDEALLDEVRNHVLLTMQKQGPVVGLDRR